MLLVGLGAARLGLPADHGPNLLVGQGPQLFLQAMALVTPVHGAILCLLAVRHDGSPERLEAKRVSLTLLQFASLPK
jgi:hypothetical protein